MPRVCTICTREDRGKINKALLTDEPLRRIAERYGTTFQTLQRHREHLPVRLVKAQDAAEVAEADDLLEQVRSLQRRALAILDTAEAEGDLRTALSAIREARGSLELLAKLLGELQQEGTINITVSPQWLYTRSVLVEAVTPYPEARKAVLEALAHADA